MGHSDDCNQRRSGRNHVFSEIDCFNILGRLIIERQDEHDAIHGETSLRFIRRHLFVPTGKKDLYIPIFDVQTSL